MAAAKRRSGLPPATVLRRLEEGLEKGWDAGLTVLTGDDSYHLDKAQRSLLRALVPGESSEFGLTVFGEQKVDVGIVVSAVRSVGMFTDRRVVLVRDAAVLDGDPDPLAAYARKPPELSHLIVRAATLDARRKLHQVLAKAGKKLEFYAPEGGDMRRLAPEVQKLAEARGFIAERPAAALLAEICAGDFYRIEAELEKMTIWLGGEGEGRITASVVRELATGSGLLSGWEVADAILLRDLEAALPAVRGLLEAGDDALKILGGINYRIQGVIQVKAMTERGMDARSAARAARLWWDRGQVSVGLDRYTLDELATFPSLLLEADRTLKSRSLPPQAVLESMLDRMMGKPVGSVASRA